MPKKSWYTAEGCKGRIHGWFVKNDDKVKEFHTDLSIAMRRARELNA